MPRALNILFAYFTAVLATSVFVVFWFLVRLGAADTNAMAEIFLIGIVFGIIAVTTNTMLPAGFVIASSESFGINARWFFWLTGAAIGLIVPCARLLGHFEVHVRSGEINLYFPIAGLLFGPIAGEIYFQIAGRHARSPSHRSSHAWRLGSAFVALPALIIALTYFRFGSTGLEILFLYAKPTERW